MNSKSTRRKKKQCKTEEEKKIETKIVRPE
jgi:hypothetical protein